MASELDSLATSFFEWRLKESPEYATTVNRHHMNHTLERISEELFSQRVEKCREFLTKLEAITKKDLEWKDQITYELLRVNLVIFIDGFKWRFHGAYNPVNFLENMPVDFVGILIGATKFDSVADFETYIQRLQVIPDVVSDQIALFQLAIKHGTTLHEVSLKGALTELDKVVTSEPQKTVFYQPFDEKISKVKDIAEDEIARLRASGCKTISECVSPAIATLTSFIREKYMPHTRTTYGVSGLPDGEEYYQECLRWHLSCDMTPREVHDIGLKEVARIRTGMEQVRKDVKFEGDLKTFMEFLRKDKQFYHDTPEKILDEYRDIIHNHIAPLLPKLFDKVPDMPLKVETMPFDGPGGMYFQPSEDGSRPGIFYANLKQPETRPRFSMVVLSLHEACPGHHFQHCFAIQEKMPSFRKELDYRRMAAAPFQYPLFTAYIEGWGLYCEYLGIELGAYRNPYDLFGRHSDEILRACRLVVDTGLHVFGWSRQQAIEYMRENTCLPFDEIDQEIDRYITLPGQACGYKIGELKIKELRRRAEETLGDKFDVKAFHEVLLKVGAVPLNLLEDIVVHWINQCKTPVQQE